MANFALIQQNARTGSTLAEYCFQNVVLHIRRLKMTLMVDSEGESLPLCEGSRFFNLTLSHDGMVSMQAPAFRTNAGTYTAKTGVLVADLRDIFNEFLANPENHRNIPDEPITILSSLLREYAEKIEALAEVVASKEQPKKLTESELETLEIEMSTIIRDITKPQIH